VSTARRRLLQGSGALAATRFTGLMGALYAQNALAATGKQTVSALSPYGALAPGTEKAHINCSDDLDGRIVVR
jgi:hypothetical protein